MTTVMWIRKKLILSVGLGVSSYGVWSIYHKWKELVDLLNRALPIRVLTGENRSSQYIYLPEDATTSVENDSLWHWNSSSTVPTFPAADGMSWKPILSRTPWELVKMARSDVERRRLLGLKLLASLHNLHPSLCRQIAQASDQRMALFLARSGTADLHMLLPPPPLPPDMTTSDVTQDLQNLLRSLPRNASHRCVQYFTALALNEIHFQFEECDSEWWHGGSEMLIPKRHRLHSDRLTESLALNALLAHSKVKEHSQEIVRSRGLQILMKFCQKFDDIESQVVVAKILSNVALDRSNGNKIAQAGWVTVLARWSRSKSSELSLSAATALANLGRDDVTFESGIYLTHPLHWDSKPKIIGDVVFIHGLLGGAFKTWRQNDERKTDKTSYTYCWPKDWLAHDCPHLRILLVDYETRLTEWSRPCPYENERRTLDARSDDMLKKLVAAGIGQQPIVWVAHSMGGLLVKHMLLDSSNSEDPQLRQVCDNTKGVVFYSVPHLGSTLASFRLGSHHLLLPSPEVIQLQQGSEELKQLHHKFSTLVQDTHVPCISFGELQRTTLGHLGLTATFMNVDSADPGFGEFRAVDTDHVCICKPDNQSSVVYHQLVRFIQDLFGQSLFEELQHATEIHVEETVAFLLSASFI